jgi:hypothetical protein
LGDPLKGNLLLLYKPLHLEAQQVSTRIEVRRHQVGTGNPFKNTNKKRAFHMFLGPPMAKAQRAAMRSLNATVPKICQYVRWSEVPVHWSRDDHPEHIPDGYYAMVVCPVIQGYEFSKCLMDGGSSLNIMYMETLTKLGLTKT